MAKAAQRQFLVSVSGIRGYFATKTGGEISSDANKVYDGGRLQPDLLAGPAQADNITVGRPYDPLRDDAVLRTLRARVGRSRHTISVVATDENLVALPGRAQVYSDALLIRVGEPEFDAASGDAATYELEFAIGAFA